MSKGNDKCDFCWGTGFYKGHGAPCREAAPESSGIQQELAWGVESFTPSPGLRRGNWIDNPKSPAAPAPAAPAPGFRIGARVEHKPSGDKGKIRDRHVTIAHTFWRVEYDSGVGSLWPPEEDLVLLPAAPAAPATTPAPSAPATTPGPKPKFKIGDRVENWLVGPGTIRNGKVDAGGRTLWDVEYDCGDTLWTYETALTSLPASPAAPKTGATIAPAAPPRLAIGMEVVTCIGKRGKIVEGPKPTLSGRWVWGLKFPNCALVDWHSEGSLRLLP